jgi:hypothetical protein
MNKHEQQQHIQRAILAGLDYYQGVKLPSPQTTGTLTQQQSYAWQQAGEIQKSIG